MSRCCVVPCGNSADRALSMVIAGISVLLPVCTAHHAPLDRALTRDRDR